MKEYGCVGLKLAVEALRKAAFGPVPPDYKPKVSVLPSTPASRAARRYDRAAVDIRHRISWVDGELMRLPPLWS